MPIKHSVLVANLAAYQEENANLKIKVSDLEEGLSKIQEKLEILHRQLTELRDFS